MRVNARLDEEYQTKIEYLKNQTGQNQTELIKQAIDLLYSKVSEEPDQSLYDHLNEIGFIGAGKGPEDLAKNQRRH